MLSRDMTIRAAMPDDIPALLKHMRFLAEFEDYIREFDVDEHSLLARAFGEHPECHIFVAECSDGLAGYAVGLIIPFTYDLKCTVVLKELFVDAGYRGHGVGSALFRHLAAWTLAKGGGRLKWDVMAGNHQAEAFYKKHGGTPDQKWIPYVMNEEALQNLQK
ncbi:GNAT family N-acetyltransferase [Nissabacter sp. SGAir0207]|uniref:GNAT family N-acetyltransferase n=1 Tax=Nissabacter sp. SGAir0207 TaxID=2126321 RepID=UPI0010CD68FF|nr:GNAT family N-acetyltransferase [Nissabacter sp. SGAir0207]QCR38098.1 GNAT family N-acetyltransferase [Nissabacter sp. SGAir0207]